MHNRLNRLARDRRMQRAEDDRETPVPSPCPVRTAADVLAILGEQVAAVRADEHVGAVERARAVGYLTSIALKAIEAGNLAARIEMLEAVLKQRSGDGKA
jgi:hypothetical protein